MCGTLFGTLPQAPQQSVFHGLPLELMEEEARLLVDQRVAVIVVDSIAHRSAVGQLSEIEKVDFLALRTQEQDKSTAANREESRKRKAAAIENAKASGKWKIKPSKVIESKELSTTEDDALFGSPSDENVEPAHAVEEAAVTGQKATFEDGNLRQYTIPMASKQVGPHALRHPKASAHVPDPPQARYQVYSYLQNLGYFMSPGLRFGCQFVAYPGDPVRFHSHFLVKSLQWDEELPILDLVGGGRLGTGVKKAWMIAGAESTKPQGNENNMMKCGDVRTFCIEWAGFG